MLGYEPTGLHAIFKQLWNNTKGKPNKVILKLETKTIKFPNDEEFKKAIIEGNLYDRKSCNSILYEYELDLQKHSKDPLIPLPKFTVDHVAPQVRKKNWKGVISNVDYAKWGNSWGNLVPLTLEGNSFKGTINYQTAKKFLFQDTPFQSTKELFKEFKVWNAHTIQKRSKSLANWAVKKWPRKI